MKNKFLLFALLIFTLNINAQGFLSAISYNTAQTLGTTKDYIGDFSWRGFSIEGRTFTQRNLSFGILFGWNYFSQKTSELINIENGAVYGTQVRTLDVIPIMGTVHYYFGPKRRKAVRVFTGLNIGTYVITKKLDIGIWSFRNSNWHFGLAPELGVLIPIESSSLMFSVKYNYAFAAGDTYSIGDDNQYSFLTFNIGFSFYY